MSTDPADDVAGDVDDAGRALRVEALQARQALLEAQLHESTMAMQAWFVAEQRTLAQLDEVAREWHALDGGQLHLQRRSVAAQTALPYRGSDRTLEHRITEAATLVREWPTWLAALEDGEISLGHLRVLQQAARPLETRPEVTGKQKTRFAAKALNIAKTTSPARARKRVARLADGVLTQPLTERHRDARQDRGVWVSPGEDGMSVLGIQLPSTLANAIDDRLLTIARTKSVDDPRTIPNVMADTAAELLLTGSHAAGLPGFAHVRGTVNVTIPVDSLLSTSLDDGAGGLEPATLDGIEALDVASARQLAAAAPVWRRLFVDPVTMAPCGIARHDPTIAQRELLAAIDLTCRFPGCAAKAWRCDIDHTHPYGQGGCTDLENLAHLCRRHHMLKHHEQSTEHRWRVEQLGHGYLAWTSPDGHLSIDEPVPIGRRAKRPVFTDTLQPPPPPPAPPEPPPF